MVSASMHIRTEHFDGPLGLLLFLLQKQDIDIRELDLTKVTRQYLAYLKQMSDLNFDVAGDYLYLAVMLLLLKSRAVTEGELQALSQQSGENDDLTITSRSELVRRLEELQRYQRLGKALWMLPKQNHDIFVRPRINRKAYAGSILSSLELDKLTTSMMGLLQREKRQYTVVEREKITVRDKIAFLKGCLNQGDELGLKALLDLHGGESLGNIVVTFISLLELARLEYITIFQMEDCGNIYIRVLKSFEHFHLNREELLLGETSLSAAVGG